MNNNINNIAQEAFALDAEDPTEPLVYEGPSEEGLRRKLKELQDRLAIVCRRRHDLTQTIIERDIELEECYEQQQHLYQEFERLDKENLVLRQEMESLRKKSEGRAQRLRDYINQREVHTRETESENKRILQELWDARIRLQEMDAQVRLLAAGLKEAVPRERAEVQSPTRQELIAGGMRQLRDHLENWRRQMIADTPKRARDAEPAQAPAAPIKLVKLWPLEANTPDHVSEFVERKRAANAPVPYGVRVQRDLLAEFPPRNEYEARVHADLLREEAQMRDVERHDNPGVYRTAKEAWENWRAQRDAEDKAREQQLRARHEQGLWRTDEEQAAFERSVKTQYKLRATAPKKYNFE